MGGCGHLRIPHWNSVSQQTGQTVNSKRTANQEHIKHMADQEHIKPAKPARGSRAVTALLVPIALHTNTYATRYLYRGGLNYCHIV